MQQSIWSAGLSGDRGLTPNGQHETEQQTGNPLIHPIWQPANPTHGTTTITQTNATHGFNFAHIPVVRPAPLPVQTKLTVGEPNDKYEQEADQVSDQVMRMPEPTAQGLPEDNNDGSNDGEDNPATPGDTSISGLITPLLQRHEENEAQPLQADSAGKAPPVSHETAAYINSAQGQGTPLGQSERNFFEPRFGYNFSRVRIHADDKAAMAARQINARAFTLGNDIFFGTNQYQPGTPQSRRLLAHELTHTVQQISPQPFVHTRNQVPTRTIQTATLSPPGRSVPALPISRAPSRALVLQRWESALPEPNLIFNVNADEPVSRIGNNTTAFLTGPLTDHKVRTGGLAANTTDQISNAWSDITSGEVRIPGTERAVEEQELSAPEIDTDTGTIESPPEITTEERVAQDSAEQIREAITEDRQRAHDAQDQHVSFPDREQTDSPNDSAGNVTEVRQRLNRINVDYSESIERPPSPEPDLSGEADPALIDTYASSLEERTTSLYEDNSSEIAQDRGENDFGPDNPLLDTQLNWEQFPPLEEEQSGDEIYQQALTESGLSPQQIEFTQNVNVVSDQLENGRAKLEQTSQGVQEDYTTELTGLEDNANVRIEEVMADAGAREAEVHEGTEERVGEARLQWGEESDRALEDHQSEVDLRIQEAESEISAEEQRFDNEAEQAIDNAVEEADSERERAEQRAEEELRRAEEEAEGGGFWSWVGSALDWVIDSIVTVISAIFDALNWVIDKIFKGLEWVIEQLVEIVRFVVVGIIQLAQMALGLLGDALEALFGEQARRWVDAINGFLNDSIDVLNVIYDWIRDALVGTIEFINQGLQAVVTLVKWACILIVMIMTGLWIRFLWIAIENFERLWNNIRASFDGLFDTMIDRSDEALKEFWTNFWTPATQLMLAVGLIIFIAGFFVGISEVVTIILLIVAVLYLATVAVELGHRFYEYGELIWNDNISGAREKLADTLLWLAFNLPFILLAIFGIRGGLKALRVREGTAGGSGRAVAEGEAGRPATESGRGTRSSEAPERIPESERAPAEERIRFIDPWVELARKYGLRADIVDMMRESGIWAHIFDRILERGVNAESAALIADMYGRTGIRILDSLSEAGIGTSVIESILADAHSLGQLNNIATLAESGALARLLRSGFDSADINLLTNELGLRGMETIDGLMENGVQRNPAIESARIANEINAAEEVRQLSTSGYLENPQGLRNFLRRVQAEVASGEHGLLNELREAAMRSRNGRVAIGQSLNPRGQADVIDHARSEALQIKTVTGGIERVINNIIEAARQLRGEGGARGRGGEVPPPGYLRIIKIIIENPNNPLYSLERGPLRQALIDSGITSETITGPDPTVGAQQLQVTNGTSSQGTPHVFAPSEFP
ncbi:MAG: DUF4157 domain-containing protein [Gammaproteobacteria bacterium]|nr:DUF4157 domain-containing protein [Gammaproteobacteria bacterium]